MPVLQRPERLRIQIWPHIKNTIASVFGNNVKQSIFLWCDLRDSHCSSPRIESGVWPTAKPQSAFAFLNDNPRNSARFPEILLKRGSVFDIG